MKFAAPRNHRRPCESARVLYINAQSRRMPFITRTQNRARNYERPTINCAMAELSRARVYSGESPEQSRLVNAADIAIMKYYNDTMRVQTLTKSSPRQTPSHSRCTDDRRASMFSSGYGDVITLYKAINIFSHTPRSNRHSGLLYSLYRDTNRGG